MNVVRLSALHTGHLYLPRKYSWYSCLLEAESTPRVIVWPKALCQWKIPVAPSGIEPVTFQLVAQCLNQLHNWASRSPSVATHYLTLRYYLPYVSTHSSLCEVCESRFLKISSVAPGNKSEWEEQILKELLRFEVNGVTYALLTWENTANFCRRLKMLKLQMTKWPALLYRRVRWFDVVEVAGVRVEFHCCASNCACVRRRAFFVNGCHNSSRCWTAKE